MSQENDELQAWPPEGWDGILEGEETTHREVVEIAQKAASAGSATAQYVLGAAHYFGKGVPVDWKEAFEWYFKAAAQGLPHAQYNLGVMYENAEACPQSHEKAFLWYEKAAAQGFAKAQHNLAALWEAGLGTPSNMQKAAHWFEEAARQNDVRAQYRLALLLLRGDAPPSSPETSPPPPTAGVQQPETPSSPPSQPEASPSPPSETPPLSSLEALQLQAGLGWLQKAVGQNFAPAKYTLGFLMEHGVGVPKNLEEARRLYAEAALAKVPEALAAVERLK